MKYDDRDYLYEQYVVKKLSTVQIARLHGLDPAQVRYRLMKFGIKTRNAIAARRGDYEFRGDAEVLYGSLLGDGWLARRNANGWATFHKKNVGYDHISYVGLAILDANPTERIKPVSNGECKTSFRFSTLCCERFSEEHNRWYCGRQKVVPRDLVLTPKTVLHWFLDDGSSQWKDSGICVRFATESFSPNDCDFLRSQLEKLGIKSTLQASHGGFGKVIYIMRRSTEDFFHLIGECPKEIPSMRYKFKLTA